MNIVMVPFHDYKKWTNEGFRTRDAHLCEHLAQREDVGRILVVNRPVSVAEMVAKRKGWKTPGGETVYEHDGIRLSHMQAKVWCIDFLLLDLIKVAKERKAWWFTAFQYQKVLDGINVAIQFLDMKDSVLMLQNPMGIGTAQHLQCRAFAFDAIDNWLYHPQMTNKELIKRNYEYVDEHADLITTVSQSLTEMFAHNHNVHWIPNGVDIDYFKAARAFHAVNEQIVIGYVGKIQDRVDFDLVERCLQIYSDCRFVFLGPIYAQKNRCRELASRYSNIVFKGDIHYHDLPREMREFDIAMIPHKVDAFTNSMNPLKLYEYLAAGKLIVSTQVAGVDQISSYVYSAENQNDYIVQMGMAIDMIKGGNVDPEQVAVSIPDECAWSSRTDLYVTELKRIVRGITDARGE